MQEQVIVKSADQYFKEYAVDGIGKGADRWMIRRQLLDAFRREMFGLITLRTKKNYDDISQEDDPESAAKARNVIRDEIKKWKKLCSMFEKYTETRNLLSINDLKFDDLGDPEPEEVETEEDDEEETTEESEVVETEGTVE